MIKAFEFAISEKKLIDNKHVRIYSTAIVIRTKQVNNEITFPHLKWNTVSHLWRHGELALLICITGMKINSYSVFVKYPVISIKIWNRYNFW